jgi:membrane protease YdiL (CAAX protease family)
MQIAKKRAITGLATAAILTTLLTMLAPSWYGLVDSIPFRIAAILSVQVAFAALAVFCHCVVEKQPLRSFGFSGNKPLLQIVWALALFAMLTVLFVGLPVLFGQALSDMVPTRDSLLFAIPYKLLFVGFAEELLFRGYFLNSLTRLINSKIASVILSSILFGLWHFILSGSIFQVIVTTTIGLIIAFPRAYAKNCSIVSVSLAHGLYDSLLNVFSWIV